VTSKRTGRTRLVAPAAALAAAASLGLTGAVVPSVGAVAGAAGSSGKVHAAKVSGVGTVLVDGAGRTLYAFAPDKQSAPTCAGTCASLWPPVYTSGTPVAGHGVHASMLGTVTVAGGRHQVTYDHWPLYTFVEDSGPGQAHGQGIVSFGGKWSTVGPAGRPFGTSGTSHKGSGSTGGGGNGY
jgi:predicted lipoprotein with Yx(FWY)xxD motif